MFKKNKRQKIRQSTRHNLVGSLLFTNKIKTKKNTQFTKRLKADQVKVIVLDGIAYWIKDNVFYMSETTKNIPNQNTAKPVNIENMPKQELDKMLFILDNLRRGDTDERSGSRD